MTGKARRRPSARVTLTDVRRLREDNARLTTALADLRKRFGAEVLRHATPALTITAETGHLLIVACAGLSMRVRTKSVSISTSVVP